MATFTLFDSTAKNKWFGSRFGTSVNENRMIDIHNNVEKSPMFIIGGEFKLGVRGEFERNVDQTMSRFFGGRGVGSDWKSKN